MTIREFTIMAIIYLVCSLVANLITDYFRNRRKCDAPLVARPGVKVPCTLPHDHKGDHAASLAALERAGYHRAPF